VFLKKFYKNSRVIFFVCSAFYFFFWLKFSGTIDPIKPDSIGYLNFFDGEAPHRISGYPMFLLFLKNLNFSIAQIAYLQLGIFAIAISIFINYLVKIGVNKLVIIIFYIGVIGNPYLNKFHFMILTESLTFSLLIFFIICVISLHKEITSKKIILLGIVCGLLAVLKPVSIVFTIIGLLFLIFFQSKSHNFFQKILIDIFLIALPIIAILFVENLVFHGQYEQRKSQLAQHLYGKAIMMTTFKEYKVLSDKSPESKMLALLDAEYNEDQKYLESLKSIQEKIAIFTLVENDAYKHPALEDDISLIATNEDIQIDDLRKSIFFKGLKTNPMIFIKMTLRHYFAFFNIKPSANFYNEFGGPKHLTNDSIEFSSSKQQKAIHNLFLIFGFCFYIFSIYLIFNILRHAFHKNLYNALKENNSFFICVLFFVIAHSIHLSHALLGVFVPRYLMLSYPYILFFELAIIEMIFNYKNSRLIAN
tara:strand:- start:2074 stop:3501 length:1428 start_codon:yes stop_codon:yes gene_type:complete